VSGQHPAPIFDVYSGSVQLMACVPAERVVLALWVMWCGRHGAARPDGETNVWIRFEANGLTVVERDPTAASDGATP
jgi:hypothetical protein